MMQWPNVETNRTFRLPAILKLVSYVGETFFFSSSFVVFLTVDGDGTVYTEML
jgi:hypothetical protein